MSVFDNYINVRYLSEVPSRSGLYVNDLYGFEITNLKDIKKQEVDSLTEFYERLYNRSVENLVSDVTNRMNEDFYIEKVIENTQTGELTKPYAALTESTCGVVIDASRSKYTETEIESIKFYVTALPSPATITIRIYSDQGGQLLDTITETVVEGSNELAYYDKRYNNDKIYIECDNIALAGTEVIDYQSGKGCDSCLNGDYTLINGGGLIVTYTTKCSVKRFVEYRLSMFKHALWYKIGEEIMLEALTSNNANCFTTMEDDQNKTLYNIYHDKKEESLDKVMKQQHIKDDRFCFSCRDGVMKGNSLP